MSPNFVLKFGKLLNYLETLLPKLFVQNEPVLAVSVCCQFNPKNVNASMNQRESFSIKELLGDSILWAVPKHRRTIEKRLNRKFGYPQYVWKPLKIKTHLRVCNQCGNDYEVGVLCPNCYDKIQKETMQMQDKIQKELGLDPVDKEVIVLYEGEHPEPANQFCKDKKIVEMQKTRPMWFSKNLIQKTTQQPTNTTEVKPSDLG